MYNKHDNLQYWCPVLYKVEPSSEMPCPSCSPVLTYISERYILLDTFIRGDQFSLNLLIFGSVNLNDEENKAVCKSVQTFIIKSKRLTPWHAHIIFFTFSILFNLFVWLFSSKLCSFQLHAYIHFFLPQCINNSHKFKI